MNATHMLSKRLGTLGLVGMALGVLAAGCVERRLSIDSRPSGALVYLNDQEVGRTPVTTHFTWYGDYDVVLRLEGHETLKTHARVKPPWYQYPVLDFVSDVLWPATVRDNHYRQFELQPRVDPAPAELLERADVLRAAVRGEPIPQEPADAGAGEPAEPSGDSDS